MKRGVNYVRRGNASVARCIESLEMRVMLTVGPEADYALPPSVSALAGPVAMKTLPAPASLGNPITIDLAVVYTPAARTAAGGTAQMAQHIQDDIVDANQALANSQIYVTLRLVGTSEVSYTEQNNVSGDLARLQNPSDGYLDSVQPMREADGADVVALYTAPSSPNAGGIAYMMPDTTYDYSDYGYAVIVMPPSGPRYALAHEVGHVMGAGHDAQTDTGQRAFPYAYGYRFWANGTQYRTVMAYDPGTRIPYFSNPNISYEGVPIGDAATANNAWVVDQLSPVVAGYRNLVVAYAQANLLPFAPSEWSGPIVVSTTAGTNTDASAIYSDQTIYVDAAVRDTAANVAGSFVAGLYVDGSLVQDLTFAPADVNGTAFASKLDLNLGTLSAGTHTIRIQVDDGGAVSELNEADNVYTKTFTVTERAVPVVSVWRQTTGGDVAISDGQAEAIEFGTVPRDQAGPSVTFRVDNTGSADLTTSSLTVPAGYIVTDPLEATIAAGGSDTFALQLDTNTMGVAAGGVSFATNVSGVSTFNFTVDGEVLAPLPDLVPYQPDGWAGRIVLSTVAGTSTDAATIYDDQPIYMDTATANVIAGSTVGNDFVDKVYLDDVLMSTFSTEAAVIDAPSVPYVQTVDYAVGRLAAGTHRLRVEVDAENNVGESDEANDVYERTFTVVARPRPSVVVMQGTVDPMTGVVDGQSTPIAAGSAVRYQTGPILSFTVRNDGTANLSNSALKIPAGFVLVDPLAKTILPGRSDVLSVQMVTSTAGTKGGKISFNTNDATHSTFDFPISGSVVADTAAPTAKLKAVNLGRRSRYAYKFTVTYTDNAAVARGSIGTGDVTVFGPGRYRAGATLVSVSSASDGTPLVATYSIPARGGMWDSADNGVYTIKLGGNQIWDKSGNITSSRTLGTFSVAIPAAAKSATFAAAAPIAAPAMAAAPVVSGSRSSKGVFGEEGLSVE